MKPELPSHLHSTRDLLMGSLRSHPTETASDMPANLLADLTTHFQASAPAAVRVPSLSWFEKLQSFVSRPAFGLAALAVAILGFALPGMMTPAPTGTSFRGAPTSAIAGESVRIFLVGAPAHVASTLENSGDFEKGAILSVATLPGSSSPRVVVDFTKSEITTVAADGSVLATETLPADNSALASAIAAAVSRL